MGHLPYGRLPVVCFRRPLMRLMILCFVPVGCSSSDETEPSTNIDVALINGMACRANAPAVGVFTESAAALGIDFIYEPMLPPEEDNPRLQDFSGVGIGDLDGDQQLDLYFAGGGAPDRVFLTATNGPAKYTASTRGGGEDDRARVVTLADIDGDGDLDALLAADSPYQALNDGTGHFGNPTFFERELGTPDVFYNVYGFAAGDTDGDQRLDVLVAVHEQLSGETLLPGAEWLHRGSATGLVDVPNAFPEQGFEDKTFLAILADFDDDGDLDVYEVNDAWSPAELGAGGSTEQIGNRLLQNTDGNFAEVTNSTSGIKVSAMGAAVGDYDNDGLLDLYVTAMLPNTNTLLRNTGGMSFENKTFSADADTLYDEHDVGWGAEFFDANSDGWLDLYVLHGWHTTDDFQHGVPANADHQRNLLLLNDKGTFSHDASATSGLEGDDWSRSPATGDLNRDGFVDVVVGNANGKPYVYLNGCDARPWLTVRLKQPGPNAHAVGARIRVTGGGLTQTRFITAGGSGLFGSSAPEAYFGFPIATETVSVSVRWPATNEITESTIPVRKLATISHR
ncbi:MAG: hypothetical protein ACI9OJ_002872 [Myxococcota bacterium]|jgi:hypothetical protein